MKHTERHAAIELANRLAEQITELNIELSLLKSERDVYQGYLATALTHLKMFHSKHTRAVVLELEKHVRTPKTFSPRELD